MDLEESKESISSVKLTEIVKEFNLEIIHASANFEKMRLTKMDVYRPGLPLTGFFEHFDTKRLMVIGLAEWAFLDGMEPASRRERFEELMFYPVPALIITRGLEPHPECLSSALLYDRTVLRTQENTSAFMSSLIGALFNRLSTRITRSGVMMEIYGEGVLFQGESGVGKSEIAIELIKRGHRLIADDAVEIRETFNGPLMATSPELIRHYMELRGIGLVNVSRLFGMGAVKREQQIDLVVRLEPWDNNAVYDRFGLDDKYTEILGVKIPEVTIPVKPGRNLASIVEVAAMNNQNRKMGHNAAKEMTARMDEYFEKAGQQEDD